MLDLKPEWKFSDVQDNIEALITQYNGELMPFLCSFQTKQRYILLHQLKKQVFGYETIMYWQRERLWETLNGDCDIETFKQIGR